MSSLITLTTVPTLLQSLPEGEDRVHARALLIYWLASSQFRAFRDLPVAASQESLLHALVTIAHQQGIGLERQDAEVKYQEEHARLTAARLDLLGRRGTITNNHRRRAFEQELDALVREYKVLIKRVSHDQGVCAAQEFIRSLEEGVFPLLAVRQRVQRLKFSVHFNDVPQVHTPSI
jgi:hypothetical protein